MSAPISINTQLLNLSNSGNLQLINTNNSGRFTMSVKGFTLYSSDFATFNTGYGCEADTTNFNIGGPYASSQAYYQPILSQNQGGNAAKSQEILNYFNNAGLSVTTNSYLFNVTYGPGSTVPSGIVVVTFYYNNVDDTNILIGTVDTTVPGWNTPGTNPFSLTALNGTFYLPLTFSLYNPTTQDINSWC